MKAFSSLVKDDQSAILDLISVQNDELSIVRKDDIAQPSCRVVKIIRAPVLNIAEGGNVEEVS